MTQRETQAMGGAITAPRPHDGEGHARRERSSREPHSHSPTWEQLFQQLGVMQQLEWLDRARTQGYILASDLPAPASHEAGLRPDQRVRQIVANPRTRLQPILPRAFDPIDRALDVNQRDAVSGALTSPDLFMIQGMTGTGKTRTAVELVRQTLKVGGRVLIVSASEVALDGLLERLESCPDVLAMRCLGRDENSETLSEAGRRHLAPALENAFRSRITQEVSKRISEREAKFALLDSLPGIYDRVEESLRRETTLRESIAETIRERESISASVDVELTDIDNEMMVPGFLIRKLRVQRLQLRESIEKLELESHQFTQQIGEQREKLDQLAQQIGLVKPKADAKSSKQWWSPKFWSGLFAGDSTGELQKLDGQSTTITQTIENLEEQIAQRAQQAIDLEATALVERESTIQQTITDRRTASEQRETELRDDLARAGEAFRQLQLTLQSTGGIPLREPTTEALRNARRSSDEQRQREHDIQQFDRDWLRFAETHADELVEQFRSSINVVAIPASAIATLPSLVGKTTFDRLIVEESHLVSEPEFLSAAKFASRWVLMGEPLTDSGDTEPRRGARPGGNRPRRRSPDFFAKLWSRVHQPVWVTEDDRLCCQLHPVSNDQRSGLESESVADFPDVELRILTPENGEPLLAEVVFPGSMSLLQAKDYLFRELNEITLQARGVASWEDTPNVLRIHWPSAGKLAADLPRGSLDKGVTEVLSADRWRFDTVAIEFDRSLGWDRQDAEKWLEQHLIESGRTLHRSAEIVTLHRMSSDLGSWVSEVAFVRCDAPRCPSPKGVCVDFHPVPGFGDDTRRREGNRGRPVSRRIPMHLRGGAGLDLDMSDARQRERVPADIVTALPQVGYVNVPEAQAVVRHLESLMLAGETFASVIVTALYPAQVELIKQFMQRSAMAEKFKGSVRVALPASLHGCEFDHVMMSLTRSHGSRAVTFGDDPRETLRILGRAKRRLTLFGDPGTLVRRSQWEGPVDHLDEALAWHERTWVGNLVRYLQGHGERPDVFQLHEGIRL